MLWGLQMSVSSSSAECFTKGMANITMRNMERTSISCPNSYTIYDYDLQILYKCEGTALIEIDMPPCESDEPESSASVTAPAVDYGTLSDSRDGKSYKTVVIGGKTWMAENLNFSLHTHGYFPTNTIWIGIRVARAITPILSAASRIKSYA